jgi:hypothetical protein
MDGELHRDEIGGGGGVRVVLYAKEDAPDKGVEDGVGGNP